MNIITQKIVIATLGPIFKISLISTDNPIAIIDIIKKYLEIRCIGLEISEVIIPIPVKIHRAIKPITNQGKKLNIENLTFDITISELLFLE